MPGPRILFIDDEETAREVARHNLERAGFAVDLAPSAEAGLARFDPREHPLVITDLRLPGKDGMAVLKAVGERSPDTAVIVITAFGDVETAVRAMRQGAYDFIPKPFNRDQLLLTVSRAMERARLVAENQRLRRERGGVERPILHVSPAMGECLSMVDRVAPTDATVLLTGESGTGKELLARRLHGRSPRHGKAFVAISCAAIPEELIESELFGHEAGAFTGAQGRRIGRFERADGGTLFLDEISELPLGLQAKLLRVLQEGQIDPLGAESPRSVDVRVVAATNTDLQARVTQGRFRGDLFYRLNVVEVVLPPLRAREGDIPLLARHFVAAAAQGRELILPPAVMAALVAHDWPGNVRELQNACERMAVLCPGETLRLKDLPPALTPGGGAAGGAEAWLGHIPPGLSLFDLERLVIEHRLGVHGGNMSAAARDLGVPRHILAYRVEKYGIRDDDL